MVARLCGRGCGGRAGLALFAALVSSCYSPATVVCEDGTLCPAGSACAPAAYTRTRCVLPQQLGQCDGSAPTCTVGTSAGVCVAGVCELATLAVCGDGVSEGGEVCDDGNTQPGDGCSADCLSRERCGNAYVDAAKGEECDCGDGSSALPSNCTMANSDDPAATCRPDCRRPRCGDGIIDGSERCDGASLAGKSCADFGYYRTAGLACSPLCAYDTSGCGGLCGDGVIDVGDEECDDAEATLGGQTCATLGYYRGALACLGCRLDAGDCSGRCGDGVRDDDRPGGAEVCDGHDFGGLACSDAAYGYYGGSLDCVAECMSISPASCVGRCGDGELQGSERCDCGVSGALPAGCTQHNSDVAADACRTSCRPAGCGDDTVDTGEVCDEGDTLPGDGCSADCASNETCGNGVVDPLAQPVGEQCDDGNESDGDMCHNDCQVARCGDGIVDPQIGEACDCGDGAAPLNGCSMTNSDESTAVAPGVTCRGNCLPPRCGDGILDVGEQCDDGDYLADDGCDWACVVEMGYACTELSPSVCDEAAGWALWPMPDSPTRFCSSGSGAVACPAPSPAGQDGNHLVNVPTYDYTTAPQVVVDSVTGLMWQRAVPPDPYPWAEASAYCLSLSLAGHSDWRVPTLIELLSIVDLGRYDPAIDTAAFPSTPLSWFWSATPYTHLLGYAWIIEYYYGRTSTQNTALGARVRCVR